jgi:hypothetical protein
MREQCTRIMLARDACIQGTPARRRMPNRYDGWIKGRINLHLVFVG